MVKKLFLLILTLIGFLLLLAFFLPSSYRVERRVVIRKNKAELYEYLRMLQNQSQYAVWAQMDPNQKNYYRGIDGQPGFVHRWESAVDSVGSGEQEIINIIPGERIEYELRFEKPYETTSHAYLQVKELSPVLTEVSWSIEGEVPYPFNIAMMFYSFEQMLGRDLEAGLANLKVLQEQGSLP